MNTKKKIAAVMFFIFTVIVLGAVFLLHQMSKVPVEISHSRVAESFIDSVQTGNEGLFDEITSDKIIKYYNDGNEETKSDVLTSVQRQLEIDFGTEVSLKVQNSKTKVTKETFSTVTSVIFVGLAEGNKDTGLFGFSLIMSDEKIANAIYYTKEEVASLALNSEEELTSKESTTEEFITYPPKYLWEY